MHYVIAIPFDPRLAESIGKKSSENSISFYNRKAEGDVIVALAPSSIEEKFYAVAESMMISSEVVVSTADLDKLFGEVLIGCSLLDKHIIFTNDGDITKFLQGAKIKDYEIADRGEVLAKLLAFKPAYQSDEVRVDIDKAFPVKGLGTIALGIVTKGTIKAHDELYHSSGKPIIIRSLQSQDVDVQEAGPGTRVGIALKGIEHDEIEKGDLLVKAKFSKSKNVSAEISVSSLTGEQIIKENYYTIVSNFSTSRCQVTEIDGNKVKLKLERQLSLLNGDEFLLIREKTPRIFARGKVLSSGN